MINPPNLDHIERRRHKAGGYCPRQNGHTTVDIECPFCGAVSTAHVWSLAGSGKRCEGPTCNAIHYSGGETWLEKTP